MALKRINKELTDLGRYVAPPPSPLPPSALPGQGPPWRGRRRLLARPPAMAEGVCVCPQRAAGSLCLASGCLVPRRNRTEPNRSLTLPPQ